MPLRRFRRQYEQLSQFEKGRIIGVMVAGWSARLVASQLGRSDCVPAASSAAMQAPSLGAPVSSRSIRRLLDERTFGIASPITCAALDAYPSTPLFGVVPRTKKLDCSGMEPGRL
ncbi:hypothetical protein TNCV_1956131 [Trichonephila clavipes]|nr:hypothetical protein TNCV_1956131 [Trichonephila clavipes]